MYKTLGGRVECVQCDAKSKRSGERCRAPAVRGKTKCRFHGGAKGSGRPITHGTETRASRIEASKAKARIRALEEIGFNIEMFAPGSTRTRGRKPKQSAGALDVIAYASSLGIWSVKD
jgi:hypothetical protein